MLLIALAVGAAGAAPSDPDSPAAELAALKILDGYDVNLFASEADGIVKPIQMRWDERGRLWVTCSTTYPQIEPGQKPHDKIVILEDTTGSGKADKSTVFADDLFIPTGIELGKGGVYVAGATQLLFLHDDTGSDKAGRREILFSGFGTGDAHQMINSFLWGPGGELWFGQGAHTFSNVETPWGVERLYSAGIWRLRPESLKLDPFLDSRRGHSTNSWAGPANPWGFAFDEWGQVFCNDAAGNRGISWIVPGLIRSDRDVPIPTLWKLPKGCGIDIIGDAHMPEAMQGRLILGHYFTASVRQFQISDDASGFALKELEPLITSNTNAFRIVDVKVGPDGAIYLCDWYNPIIGHYQASYRDPARDKTHGRIWRLTAKGRPLLKRPDLAAMSPGQLLEELRSSDRWTTYQARRLLFNLPSEQVVPATDAWVATFNPADPQYEHLLYCAIGIFEAHEAVRPDLLAKLIGAKDYRARAYAARVVGHWQDRLAHPLDLLRTLVQDDQPRVRVEAIVASTFVPDPRAMEIAAVAADRPIDQWINHAMLRAVDATKDIWRPAFARGEIRFDGKVNRLSWVLRCDGSPEVAGPVRKMLDASTLEPKASSDLAVLLANIGNADDLTMLLKSHADDPRVLSELGEAWRIRKVRPTGDLSEAVLALFGDPNTVVQRQAIRLAGTWELIELAGRVREFSASNSAPVDTRVAALAALGDMRAVDRASLEPLLAKNEPAQLRIAAAAALTDIKATDGAQAAAKLLTDLNDPDRIGDVLAIFMQRKGRSSALAKAISAARLPANAAQRCIDVLHARGRDDPALSAALNLAMGVTDQTPPWNQQYVDELATDSLKQGDANRGRDLYQNKLVACAACHTIHGKGGIFGPDLSGIGRGLTREFIIESVLWPKRVVKEGYLSISISTKDGGEFSGYALSENASELQLRDIATGVIQRIPKASITKRVDAGTIMPDGLTASLSRGEFCDLISYLCSLGKNANK
jgi:putative heme-binding domain-containing protein